MRCGQHGTAWRWTILLAAALLLPACDPPRHYSQATPESTLQAAVEMVQSGDADRLPDLVYADSERMRALLDRLGSLLGHMGELGLAVEQNCSREVEILKAAADERVKDGSVESLFAGFGFGNAGGDGRAGEILARVYADPYGWLERGAERVSFITLTDNMAVIHFDDQPALSALGIAMKKEEGRWYLQLPTNLASRYMPRTEEQWLILESIIAVFDRTAQELTRKVRAGEIQSLTQLGSEAEDRLLIPAAIAFGAYAKEMDVRERAEKSLRRYRTARKNWEEWRAQTTGEPAISSILRRVMDRIAVVQLEHAARMEEKLDFEGMSSSRFQTLATEWLVFHGVPVRMDQPLAGEDLDARLEAWEAANQTLRTPRIERERSNEPLRWLRRPS